MSAQAPKCTPNMTLRKIPRDVHEDARDATRALMGTPEFVKSRNERKKVEMRFAHLKTHHGFDRMRLRGLSGARDEFHLAAIVASRESRQSGLFSCPKRCTRCRQKGGSFSSNGRSAQLAGNRERIRCICQGTCAGRHGGYRRSLLGTAAATRAIRPHQPSADNVLAAGVRGGWRPDELRREPLRFLPPRRIVRRQDYQGRKARRPADRAADEIPPGDQSQDRRRAWRDHPRATLHLRRRGSSSGAFLLRCISPLLAQSGPSARFGYMSAFG